MMLEQIARYLIGALVGAVIAWLAALSWHGRQLAEWERAAELQQAAERARIAKRNEEVVNGWSAAVAVLRGRLDAGWRPTIPRGMPAAGVPAAAGGADGRPADPVPAAGGAPGVAVAAPSPDADLRACRADLDRLIRDGAETTLQVRAWQSWAQGVTRGPGDPAR